MLRTIADGIEALAENRLLVLLLEDLHLGDFATLELLAALALRRGPAHLVVLGTFRAAEEYPATARFQSLKQQLLLHRQCEEIALGPLRFAEIESYLAKRFPALQLPEGLPELLYRRTDGNPLFVGRLVDRWAEGGILRADPVRNVLEFDNTSATTQIPGSLRAMIEQRAAALEEGERTILECASVAGVQFFSRAVAAAAGMQREEVEAICSGLVRRHGFLVALDTNDPTLPDLGAHYAFSHGLYQQVLYQQVDPTRRQRFHRSVAESLREAWSSRSKEIAPELASHFENGADLRQAVHYFEQAAARAAEQGANREAVGYLDRGLRLLERGDGDEILNRRLDLLILRGPALLASYGYASLHVFENYAKALEIAQTLANPIRQMSSLLALSVFQQTRGELTAAAELALELVRVTEKAGFPEPILAQVRNPLSQALMYQGRVEESLRLSDAAVAGMLLFPMPTTAPDNRPSIWADPSVMLYCQQGSVSFAAGRIRQAKAAVDEALRIAREIRHPFNLASVLTFTAVFEDTAGNWPSAIAAAEEAIGIAHRYDFPFWQGLAEIVHGHATARMGKSKGGAARLREGIARLRETGAQLGTCNYLNLLADALLTEGDPTAARTSLDESEARAEATGERAFLAETYRLRAECLYRAGRPTSARDSLKQAIKIARQQANRIWELRACLALHQHWPSAQTRRALAAAAHVFDGEIATADVTAARTALADGA